MKYLSQSETGADAVLRRSVEEADGYESIESSMFSGKRGCNVERDEKDERNGGVNIEVGAFHARFVECSRSSVESDAKGKVLTIKQGFITEI